MATLHQEFLEEARRGNLHLSWKYHLYWGGFRLWEVATSLRQADLTLFLNQYDLDYAVKQLGVESTRARVVANGIPAAFLNLPLADTPKTQETPIGIAQVGSYISRKGVQYAAPALNSIMTRYPQVRMTFLGTNCPVEEVLADYEPSLRDQITIVPHFDHAELPTLLKGHNIKLFPTLADGFGKVLIEAMACGLAPVTTATPGPLAIVRDGDDALVIPPRDSLAIEQALERLITDRDLLERLRHNAYEKAQTFSWSRIARERIQLYEKYLGSPRS